MHTIKEIIEFFSKEWDVIKPARVTVIGLCLLCLFGGYEFNGHEVEVHEQALNDRFNSEVQARANEKEVLEERIAKKDDLLTDYRNTEITLQSQLSSSKSTRTPGAQRQLGRAATRFSQASNATLRLLALKLATNMRDLAHSVLDMPNPNDEKFGSATRDLIFTYESKYQGDAIVLKDEILTRLSGTLLTRRNDIDVLYTSVDNPLVLEEVATDLDTLARELPN